MKPFHSRLHKEEIMSCTNLLSPYEISIVQGNTPCTVSISIPTLNESCSQQEKLSCSGTSCILNVNVPVTILAPTGAVNVSLICDNITRTTVINLIPMNYTCQYASVTSQESTTIPVSTTPTSTGIIPPNPSGTSNPSSGIKLVGHQALLILAFMGAMTVLSFS